MHDGIDAHRYKPNCLGKKNLLNLAKDIYVNSDEQTLELRASIVSP